MDYKFTGFGLEIVGKCNASCEFCSWGHNKDVRHKNVFTGEEVVRSTGKIDLKLVDDIFDVHNPGAIIFTGLSEPFLAPDRLFYVADKLEKKNGAFAIYTNGSLLTPEHSKKLLKYKSFRSLHMSLNGATDDTRKKVMNLSLDKAKNNMESLLSFRKDMGREDDTDIGCVFMMTSTNRSEEHAFRSMWSGMTAGYKNCNQAGVFLTTNWNGECEMPWVKSSGGGYCNQWDSMSPTISVDGQIYLCCYSTRLTFGHCLDSEAVKKWVERKSIYGVSREGSPTPPKELCGGCTAWKNVSWA